MTKNIIKHVLIERTQFARRGGSGGFTGGGGDASPN
jgi:hypothetical protein